MKWNIGWRISACAQATHRKCAVFGLLLMLTCLGRMEVVGQVKIVGFDGHKLTWTNAVAPASYQVEYSTNLTHPWVELTTVSNTSETAVTVDTQGTGDQMMFYRVVWLDAPVADPVGTWVYEGYEGDTVTVRGTITVESLDPFNAQLRFDPPAQPGANHLVGQYSSQSGSYRGNRLRVSVPNYSFALEGLVFGDEINGTWTRISGGIGFPTPTPPRIYSGNFRATRAE